MLTHEYDVKAVRQINSRMTDQEVIRIASQEDRIIITMDKDFGELVYHSMKKNHGVLLLRMGDATADEKRKILENIMKNHEDKLENHFCVYQNGRFRIKKLN